MNKPTAYTCEITALTYGRDWTWPYEVVLPFVPQENMAIDRPEGREVLRLIVRAVQYDCQRDVFVLPCDIYEDFHDQASPQE